MNTPALAPARVHDEPGLLASRVPLTGPDIQKPGCGKAALARALRARRALGRAA